MSSERKLVSAILSRGEITTALEGGISESVFMDSASKKAFLWIFRYYSKYRIVPTKERFKRQFPEFRLLRVRDSDPFEDICEEVLGNVRYKFVVESIREIAEAIDDEDPTVYDKFVKAGMSLAGITSVGSMVKVRDMDRRIDQYEKDIAEEKSPFGIKFGLPKIDEATFGMHKGDFVTIAARLGTGKSNLLKHILKQAFFDHKNAIVFSFEESQSLFQRRFDAYLNDLSYKDLKGMSLPPDEIKRWRANSTRFKEEYDNEIAIISGLRRMSPETILAHIERFRPDFVAIDGVHLMRMGGGGYSADWQRITMIMDEIKQMALYTQTPIIGVVQANRTAAKEGVNSENLSFADAIGQLSDVVIGIWQDKKMEAAQIAALNLAKNRDGPKLSNMMYRWKLGPERIDIHELSEKEIKEIAVFDDSDDE